jgi:uncharacterized glyoxalase superfamily protein PhnB
MVKKITPVLFVKEIEPVLPFWLGKLSFTKTIEVPDGSKLAFAAFKSGNAEIMYQTYASADQDLPSVSAAVRKGPTFLYIEVENLEVIKSAVKGAEVYLPERTTFYGAKEIGVKDPAGHFITFAQFS